MLDKYSLHSVMIGIFPKLKNSKLMAILSFRLENLQVARSVSPAITLVPACGMDKNWVYWFSTWAVAANNR